MYLPFFVCFLHWFRCPLSFCRPRCFWHQCPLLSVTLSSAVSFHGLHPVLFMRVSFFLWGSLPFLRYFSLLEGLISCFFEGLFSSWGWRQGSGGMLQLVGALLLKGLRGGEDVLICLLTWMVDWWSYSLTSRRVARMRVYSCIIWWFAWRGCFLLAPFVLPHHFVGPFSLALNIGEGWMVLMMGLLFGCR